VAGRPAREQGSAEGADQAAVADAVMLAVSKRLAPRYVARPGASSDLQVQVQGMNLQRYAELSRVGTFGARLQMVDGATLTYGSTATVISCGQLAWPSCRSCRPRPRRHLRPRASRARHPCRRSQAVRWLAFSLQAGHDRYASLDLAGRRLLIAVLL
jgi:hypothetical protein